MGFIDSDSHVLECEDTWDCIDPSEREYRPITLEYPGATGPGAESRRHFPPIPAHTAPDVLARAAS